MGKNFFIVIVLTAFCTQVFAQPAVDGFMKGKGNLDIVGGMTFEKYSEFNAFGGRTKLGRTTTSASIFVAAGLTNWLDVQVNLPYVITNPQASNLQDVSTYLKGRFLNKTIKNGTFSAILVSGFSTPITDYQTEGLHAIGQKATAFDGRLVVQYFLNNGWFGMLQGGFTTRSTPTPSSVPVAFKIGKAGNSYYFDIYYDVQEANGGTDYRDGSNSPLTTLGISHHKLGGTFYKPISGGKMGIAIGAYTILTGRNVGQSTGASAAFIYKIKYLKANT